MQASISPAAFLQALSEQFPDAIGVVPVNPGAHHGAVVAFGSVEAQTKACSTGVQVNNITIIGTPTLSTNSSVFRISLERLPILRPDELTPLLRKTLSHCFFGKGYAMIDTAQTDGPNFRELVHEMHLDSYRIIMASWREMEKHCFYCHKPGHTRQQCPKLEARRVKTCYACSSPDHLFRNCPKRDIEPVGDKRPHTDHIEPKVREVSQEGSIRTMRKNRREPITVGDFIRPAQSSGKPKLPKPNDSTQETQHDTIATELDTEDNSDSDYALSESDKDSEDEQMYSDNPDKDNMDLDKDEVDNLLQEASDPSGQSNSTQSL
ncbi:hypothetical protein G6F56_009492 [Rhizopus delemar]|nr:hypothetical protein G6F56_009492 [Rhizopus delemar]